MDPVAVPNERDYAGGGLRPLRAVGSLYEPEAVRAIGAYAPEGRWKNTEVEKMGRLEGKEKQDWTRIGRLGEGENGDF